VLAVQTRAKLSFVPQPPVEVLRSLADQVNDRRLPEFDLRLVCVRALQLRKGS
jgi:hypothetical protein